MSQQQKAALLLAKQGKIEVGTRPIPSPQGKQALVKIIAAATVLGSDGAGVIESVGSEVTNFKTGDKIFFQGQYSPSDAGLFQQYALVDTEVVSKIPNNINPDQASTIPVASIAALFGLFQKSGVAFPEAGPTATGKSVFIPGGSSSVGQFAIQLARIAGFSPIVTTSSAQHTEHLKDLGATHVLARDADAQAIHEKLSGPVSVVLDSISAPTTHKLAVEVLTTGPTAPCAHLAVVMPLDASLAKSIEGKVTVNSVWGSSHAFKDLSVPYWKIIGQWIEEGKIVPNRVQLVDGGLEGVAKAFDLSRKGVSGVKLVVHPQE